MGEYASPFEYPSEPEEPPRGTVLAYQRLGYGGAVLDYVSFRAGDGRWYTTGRNAQQGVSWAEFWTAVRGHAVGVVSYASAWTPLANPAADAVRGHLENLRDVVEPLRDFS